MDTPGLDFGQGLRETGGRLPPALLSGAGSGPVFDGSCAVVAGLARELGRCRQRASRGSPARAPGPRTPLARAFPPRTGWRPARPAGPRPRRGGFRSPLRVRLLDNPRPGKAAVRSAPRQPRRRHREDRRAYYTSPSGSALDVFPLYIVFQVVDHDVLFGDDGLQYVSYRDDAD